MKKLLGERMPPLAPNKRARSNRRSPPAPNNRARSNRRPPLTPNNRARSFRRPPPASNNRARSNQRPPLVLGRMNSSIRVIFHSSWRVATKVTGEKTSLHNAYRSGRADRRTATSFTWIGSAQQEAILCQYVLKYHL